MEQLLKFFLELHTYIYRLINKLAVFCNNGIHPKHRIINYHKFFLDNICEGDIVLDIGCGNGALTYELAKKAKNVLAIDKDYKNIKKAKAKYNAENIEYIAADVTKYEFKQKFDAVILSNVLEHIKERRIFLLKIKKLSSKFLIRVPLLERDWLTLYKKEKGVDYRLDKTHYIEYTLEEFQDEISHCGLSIDSFYIKFGELYCIVKN